MVTAVTAGGVWVSLAAGVSSGRKKYPGKGGVFVSGGVGVGGLWRARWWLLVVCLCLSVGFKVFSAMFFYMYENMAEFCLLGVRGVTSTGLLKPGRDSRQGMAHARQAREGSKPNRNPKTRVYWVGSNQQKTSQQTHGAPMGYGGKSRPPAPENRHKGV